MHMPMNGHGHENGVDWWIDQIEERSFRIRVRSGEREISEAYDTFYPTLFGLDVADHAEIEAILDRLIRQIQEA